MNTFPCLGLNLPQGELCFKDDKYLIKEFAEKLLIV